MASKHHVLIVGAGTGGLMLAMLLERASISYEVFEKASEVKPLGSAIVITSLMQVFEQLGMKEDILAMSKPFGALHIRDETMSLKGSFFTRAPYNFDNKERYGDYPTVLARPDLIELLLARVPAYKIHYNKRVVTTVQDENKVLIQCHDGSEHNGTILVGADGAYSTIRHNMYKGLQKAGTLPSADMEPLSYDYDCVVGITKPLDLESYAVFLETFCEFEVVLGKEIPFTMVPFGGQGANMAILSAVELANLLYDTTSVTQDETTHIFEEYYETRHTISRISVEQSNQNGALIHKRGFLGDIARYLFLNWVPTWLIKMHADQFNVYRPQVSFLPFVKLGGSFKSRTSKPSRRMQDGSH
ncbi:hypothetical protein BGZ70_009494 [Mortierella alpina]|uniref:FAD-binding domain-containing protein n=1 Tax=Mortierella alpina TaxID=64518 RepID=A0A9P6J1D6_MORAP|nr:hypothetical protein BGZ70_009494 [Mortierella alpina]